MRTFSWMRLSYLLSRLACCSSNSWCASTLRATQTAARLKPARMANVRCDTPHTLLELFALALHFAAELRHGALQLLIVLCAAKELLAVLLRVRVCEAMHALPLSGTPEQRR